MDWRRPNWLGFPWLDLGWIPVWPAFPSFTLSSPASAPRSPSGACSLEPAVLSPTCLLAPGPDKRSSTPPGPRAPPPSTPGRSDPALHELQACLDYRHSVLDYPALITAIQSSQIPPFFEAPSSPSSGPPVPPSLGRRRGSLLLDPGILGLGRVPLLEGAARQCTAPPARREGIERGRASCNLPTPCEMLEGVHGASSQAALTVITGDGHRGGHPCHRSCHRSHCSHRRGIAATTVHAAPHRCNRRR
jgi:hypothetical protein